MRIFVFNFVRRLSDGFGRRHGSRSRTLHARSDVGMLSLKVGVRSTALRCLVDLSVGLEKREACLLLFSGLVRCLTGFDALYMCCNVVDGETEKEEGDA